MNTLVQGPGIGVWRALGGMGAYAVIELCIDLLAAALGLDTFQLEPLLTLAATWALTLLFVAGRPLRGFTTRLAIRSFPPAILFPLIPMMIGWKAVTSAVVLLLPKSWVLFKWVARDIPSGLLGPVLILLVVPIGEELFYRGWMFRGLRVRYGAVRSAILSALLFALVHVNPANVLLAFSMGIVFAWLVYRTGSIWPAVVAHSVVNTGPFIINWLDSTNRINLSDSSLNHISIPVVAVSAVAVLVGWRMIERRCRPRIAFPCSQSEPD